MSQLRLAYVNCKIVSRNSRPTRLSCDKSGHTSRASLPSLARKAQLLHERKPGAAAVIEKLVDDLLSELGTIAFILGSALVF